MTSSARITEIYPTDRVTLREVGLRDGLQMVRSFPSTAAKKNWLELERAAGVRHFEIGSFLPAARYPQFADLDEMISTTSSMDGVHSSALTLNERGLASAFETDINEIVCVISATEEHSQANMRRSREAAVDLVRQAAEMRKQSSQKAVINAAVAMAFGCSIAGRVDPAEVLRLAEACLEAGADIVGIADTVGYAGPDQVAGLASDMTALCGDLPFIVHLHDTRGMAIANASAALDAGARVLDGSLGGLGGCPFAPGATGNVVMEDLAFLCETKGFETGIDLAALTAVRSVPTAEMPDEKLYGAIARAGTPDWKT